MTPRFLVALGLVAFAATAPPVAAQPQPPVADSGIKRTTSITRVNFFRFPDATAAAAANRDMLEHLVPIWEAEKKAGLLVAYSTMTNATRTSETDWQLGIVLTYRNWAALDSVGAKAGPITLAHYGTAEARTAANDRRGKLRIAVSSVLVTGTSYSR
jgi:hypothetical protein